MTTVFVTRYAITEGVIPCERIADDGKFVEVVWPCGLSGKAFFKHQYVYATAAAAVARAELMRRNRIAGLRKQIASLEAMKFEVKPWFGVTP